MCVCKLICLLLVSLLLAHWCSCTSSTLGLGIRRIAIVDFDAHHGNGTEQIIRNVGLKFRKLQVIAAVHVAHLSCTCLNPKP